MTGEVMFHKLIHKTQAEVDQLKHQKQQKTHLKLSRKRQQEMNVKKKMAAKQKKVKKSNDDEVGDDEQMDQLDSYSND